MSSIQTRITDLLSQGVPQVVIDTLKGSMNDEDFLTNTEGMITKTSVKKGRKVKSLMELTEEDKARIIEEQKRKVAFALHEWVGQFDNSYDEDQYEYVCETFMGHDDYDTKEDVMIALGMSVVGKIYNDLIKVKNSAGKVGRATERTADGDTIKVAFKDGIVRHMKVINQKEKPFHIDVPDKYRFIDTDKSVSSGQVYFSTFTINRNNFDDVEGTCDMAVQYQKSKTVYTQNDEGVWMKTDKVKPWFNRCGCKMDCKKKHEHGKFSDIPNDQKVGKCYTVSTNEGISVVVKTSENAPVIKKTTTPPTTVEEPFTLSSSEEEDIIEEDSSSEEEVEIIEEEEEVHYEPHPPSHTTYKKKDDRELFMEIAGKEHDEKVGISLRNDTGTGYAVASFYQHSLVVEKFTKEGKYVEKGSVEFKYHEGEYIHDKFVWCCPTKWEGAGPKGFTNKK